MAKKLKPSDNYKNGQRTGSQRAKYSSHVFDQESMDRIKSNIIDGSIDDDLPIIAAEDKSLKHTEGLFPHQYDIEIDINNLNPAPEEWNFFPIPDQDTIQLMSKSIYYQGQLSPILVWEQSDNSYMILGGHTRYQIFRMLCEMFPEEKERFSKIRCHVYAKNQLDDEMAQYIIVINNMTQRAKESISTQVKSITKAFELEKHLTKLSWGKFDMESNKRVAEKFNMSHSTVDRLYRLRTLIPPFMDMLNSGDLAKGLALKLAVKNEELQNQIFNSGILNSELTPLQISGIGRADTIEDVEAIARAKFVHTFSGPKVTLPYKLPKNFAKISIAVDKKDSDLIAEWIIKNIDDIPLNNPESKKVLCDSLSSK